MCPKPKVRFTCDVHAFLLIIHNSLPISHFFFHFPQKPGKWCAMHVHIAWQVYHHQQKIKVSEK